MTKCSQCGVCKPVDDYYVDKRTGKPRRNCKACVRKQTGEYQRRNRDRASEMQRNWRLKNEFGISADDYDRLLAQQNGVCAICGGQPRGRGSRLAVDHCHQTGRVRGLLCGSCNRGLGFLCDREEVLAAAAEYLEASGA